GQARVGGGDNRPPDDQVIRARSKRLGGTHRPALVIYYSGGPYPPDTLRGGPCAPLRFCVAGSSPPDTLRGGPCAPLRFCVAGSSPPDTLRGGLCAPLRFCVAGSDTPLRHCWGGT